MVNFLKETASIMINYGLNPEDIIYIGNGKESCSWDEFQTIANINYDNGWGGAEIDEALIIVFANGVEMHRGEYDGSEWWDVHVPFKLENFGEQRKLRDVRSGW